MYICVQLKIKYVISKYVKFVNGQRVRASSPSLSACLSLTLAIYDFVPDGNFSEFPYIQYLTRKLKISQSECDLHRKLETQNAMSTRLFRQQTNRTENNVNHSFFVYSPFYCRSPGDRQETIEFGSSRRRRCELLLFGAWRSGAIDCLAKEWQKSSGHTEPLHGDANQWPVDTAHRTSTGRTR